MISSFAQRPHGTEITRFRTVILIVVTLALALPAFAQVPSTEPIPFLTGKLETLPGTGLILQSAKKNYSLSARTTYLFHTLQDKRLANRQVRLEGTKKPDGTFEVAKLFTVRNGKLYRVRYFCEVCNIEALEPGNCVCCQQPTELQEIPVDESK
jgi:hypothetical protein